MQQTKGKQPREDSHSKTHTQRSRVSLTVARLNNLTGWKAFLVNVLTALVVPSLLVLSVEGTLRLFNFGYETTFCLQDPTGQYHIDNDRFAWQFYSPKSNLRPTAFRVPLVKAPGSARILILGESAAAGTPERAYNFGRILERMLQERFPGKHLDVINAAMPGINSHVIRPLAQEACRKLKPDVVIIFMGNNEAVGLHAPGPKSGRFTSRPTFLRLLQWVRSTRLGQLAAPLMAGLNQEGAAAEAQTDTFFQERRLPADDPRRAAVYANFQQNLEAICESACKSGAHVILSSVPVNLADSPPFGSLHRSNLTATELAPWEEFFKKGAEAQALGQNDAAVSNFTAAAAIDDHYAELSYRLGELLLLSGKAEQAQRQFIHARDWDALQFRTDSRQNEIIRMVSEKLAIPLVNTAAAFSAARDSGFTDQALFRDHVHPTFDGDYLIAKTLLEACEGALQRSLGRPASSNVLSKEACAARLAFTEVTEARLSAQICKMTALPPFATQYRHPERQREAESRTSYMARNIGQTQLESTLKVFQEAIAERPSDWHLRFNFARLLLSTARPSEAAEQFEAAYRLVPQHGPVAIGWSAALARSGKRNEAIALLRTELKRRPESRDARAGLQELER